MPSKNNYWPPLKGAYRVISQHGDVAVITRASTDLYNKEEFDKCSRIAIIGSCTTENVGIDKIITNIITNGKIRCVLICGDESKGHNVGDAINNLVIEGVDADKRIIKATGDDPRLNTKRVMIERFREQITSIKMINSISPEEIIKAVNEMPLADMLEDYPYDIEKEANELINNAIKTSGAKIKLRDDKKGYFLVELMFNHIILRRRDKGRAEKVIVGRSAEEICNKILELKLIKNLGQAMYLARELKTAEQALKNSSSYLQNNENLEGDDYPKPVLIEALNLSEAWVKAMAQVYLKGEDNAVGKYSDANIRELPVIIHIKRVKTEPLIHHAAPKLESREVYAKEFIEGTKQVDEAVKALKRDPATRGLIINTKQASSLVLIQPRINNGFLNFFASFKSQDAYNTLPLDSYAITRLQEQMARELGVKTGGYTQTTISMQLQDNLIETVEELLRSENLIE